MSKPVSLIPLVLSILLLISCSHQKRISVDALRSNLRRGISFAAEVETFIDYVSADRATREYAAGHLAYLVDEVNRTAKELHDASPGAISDQKLQECRFLLDNLSNELAAVRPFVNDPERLAGKKEQIAGTRKALEEANSSL